MLELPTLLQKECGKYSNNGYFLSVCSYLQVLLDRQVLNLHSTSRHLSVIAQVCLHIHHLVLLQVRLNGTTSQELFHVHGHMFSVSILIKTTFDCFIIGGA